VDTRRASAEQELARLDAEQHALEHSELETALLMDYCTRVLAKFQHFTLEEKRQALEALNITVTWHPEKPLDIRGSILIAIPLMHQSESRRQYAAGAAPTQGCLNARPAYGTSAHSPVTKCVWIHNYGVARSP
jgi:hypothetical protein